AFSVRVPLSAVTSFTWSPPPRNTASASSIIDATRASTPSTVRLKLGISTLRAPTDANTPFQYAVLSASSPLAAVRPITRPPFSALLASRKLRSACPCDEQAPPIRTSVPACSVRTVDSRHVFGDGGGDLRRGRRIVT